MKKLIIILLFFILAGYFSINAQTLQSIDPDSAFQGTSIKALIVSNATHFSTATFSVIRLNQGPNQINRDSFTVINDTALYAYFTIAITRPTGTYNLIVNNNIDGIMQLANKFWVLTSPYAPALLSIDPDSTYQGSSIKALIVAKNTNFTIANFTVIRLFQGMNQINRDSFTVINDTALYAYFTIAITRPTGVYNLTVNNSVDGNLQLANKFWVTISPFAPQLLSIDPDSAYQGTSIKALIIAKNTNFTTANFTVIRLSQGINQINRDSFTVINDTALFAYFTIAFTRPAGVYTLTVNNSIDGNLSMANKFWVVLSPYAPKLLSINPDSAMQGTAIKALIIAANTKFTTASFTVIRLSQTMNQINYDSFSVINDTALYAYFTISMSRPVGVYNLAVNNSIDGNLTLNNSFWVTKSPYTPVLLSIDPDSVEQGVSFKGLILASNTKFKSATFSAIRLTRGPTQINYDSFIVINDTALYAYFTIAMTATVGQYNLIVNDNFDGNMTKIQAFTIIVSSKAPKIFSIDPDSAIQGSNVSITILGTNTHFDSGLNLNVSLFRAPNTTINPSTINRINDTAMIADFAITTTMAAGLWDVRVNNSIDGNLTLAQSFTVVVNPNPPRILKVDPDTFFQGKNYILKITATKTKFTSGSKPNVRLSIGMNNLNPDSVVVLNDTILHAYYTIALTANLGLYNLTVSGGVDGNLALANAVTILISPTAPQISKVNPAKAYQGDKVAIYVYGKNVTFTNGTNQQVRLNRGGGGPGANITPDSTKVVHDSLAIGYFSIATTAQAGLYNVQILNTVHGTLSLPQSFEIMLPPSAPQIKNLTPSRGTIGTTVPVIIYCANTTLTKSTGLAFAIFRQGGGGTINGTNIVIVNDSTVTADLAIPGTAVIGLYNARMQNTPHGTLTLINGFEVVSYPVKPKIVSVDPDSAYYGQNNLVMNIICSSTMFTKAKSIKIEIISPSIALLAYDSIKVVHDSSLNVFLSIPKNAELGEYDIIITTDADGSFSLLKGFSVVHNVSAGEINVSEIRCYPNPANEELFITSNTNISSVELIDITGKVLLRKIGLNTNQCKLTLTAYNKGVYFVRIVNEDQLTVSRIIKN